MQIRADCFAVSVGNERAAVIGNERKVCAILRTSTDGHGVCPILGIPASDAQQSPQQSHHPNLGFGVVTYIVEAKINAFNRP